MKNVNSEVAYNYIRKRILNGEYTPGYPLKTNDLSTAIGVSRTPVRDALRQLETNGLVSIRPHLGASVKAMELKEFRELCGLRLALESYAAGLAAKNRTSADLLEINFALENMRQLTEQIIGANEEQPMLAELMKEDVRFHIAIMTAAKSDLMKNEILRLHLINRVVSGPAPSKGTASADKLERDAHRRAVLASHGKIYQAVEREDSATAKIAMEQHIQDAIDNSIRIMARAASGAVARELTEEESSYMA